MSLGSRVAEDERNELASYFVETENWRKVYSGEVDLIFAPKGGGKSAIYSMMMSRESELFDARVLLVPAENPSGGTAFSEIERQPPTDEDEFVGLWKLYFLSLIARTFAEYELNSPEAKEVLAQVRAADLIALPDTPKRQVLRRAMDYVKTWFHRLQVEVPTTVDPSSGAWTVVPTISFKTPTAAEEKAGIQFIDDLLVKADRALVASDLAVWVLLDRLDVAFAAVPDLEVNALRALFRVYGDLRIADRIRLKIFLRSDIWSAISRSGFREASHLTRDLRITWSESALLQLVVQRLLKSEVLRSHYAIERDEVLADITKQRALFYRIYPPQIDQGSKKPATLDWCLSRTKDGTGVNAPRELIHLLSETRNAQLQRFERGQSSLEGESVTDRQAFKDALPQVSEVRLQQTIYAEHPVDRPFIEALEGQKTRQSVESLARIWSISQDRALATVESLVEIGLFEKRGKDYWMPFLYRPALKMVQGSAEGVLDDNDD